MNKKGMGIGQVFIFIVAAITFALIMIFGYRAITDFVDKGEDVKFVQFKSDLETSIKKIHTEFGATRLETFYPPAEYTKICFVNLDFDAQGDVQTACGQAGLLPGACLALEDAQNPPEGKSQYDQVDENVFLSPPSTVKMKVYKIMIDKDEPGLCIPISGGRFTLGLEGKGDRTLLFESQENE